MRRANTPASGIVGLLGGPAGAVRLGRLGPPLAWLPSPGSIAFGHGWRGDGRSSLYRTRGGPIGEQDVTPLLSPPPPPTEKWALDIHPLERLITDRHPRL